MGFLEPTELLSYTTKRGYCIIQQEETACFFFNKELQVRGQSVAQRRAYFDNLWHPWKHKKIASTQWLAMAEGLTIGVWRRKIQQSGICYLCTQRALETNDHGLLSSSTVSPLWEQLRQLRQRASLDRGLSSWKEALYGTITTTQPPIALNDPEEDLSWTIGKKKYVISNDAFWDIAKAAFIWFVWYQKCAGDLRNGKFLLGVVLYGT